MVTLSQSEMSLGKIYAGVTEMIGTSKGERMLVLRNFGNLPA
jgi:hypothetical protein